MSWRFVSARRLGCGLSIGLLVIVSCAAQAAQSPLEEAGLQENKTFDRGGYQLNTWRFKDATGALAGSMLIPNSTALDNYVLTCQGKCPKSLSAAAVGLPKLAHTPLPILHSYMPAKGLVPSSERYVVGPVGLNEAAPQIPVPAAAFQFGTEADIARYRLGKKEATLALLSYPTPSIARQQLAAMQKIPGATAKRSGPLVGLVLTTDAQVANALLKDLEYTASLSWDQQPPLVIRPQTAAQIVVGGIELSFIVMAFCLLSGLTFAAVQFARKKIGRQDALDSMIVLGLRDK